MASVFAIRRENTMDSGQVHSWFGHQSRQLANKIQRFEYDMNRAVVVWCFELMAVR